MKAKSLFGKQTCTGDPPGVRLGFVFALPGRSILLQGLEQPRFASIPNWLCLAPFAVPGPPQRELPDTLVLSARVSCLLRSRHPSSPVLVIRPGLCHPPFGLRHPPSPISPLAARQSSGGTRWTRVVQFSGSARPIPRQSGLPDPDGPSLSACRPPASPTLECPGLLAPGTPYLIFRS